MTWRPWKNFRILELDPIHAERIRTEHLPNAFNFVQGNPHGDDELCGWQVYIWDHLCARMLNLETWVQLQEVPEMERAVHMTLNYSEVKNYYYMLHAKWYIFPVINFGHYFKIE